MKKQLFIITVLVFSVLPSTVLFSQSSTVNFVYDKNGNRYSRQLVIVEETKSDFVASDGSLSEDSDGLLLSEMDIKLYPNPTYGQFSIEIGKNPPIESIRISLLSPEGKILSDTPFDGQHMDFDISSNSSGIYLLKLYSTGQNRIWKIIKQ